MPPFFRGPHIYMQSIIIPAAGTFSCGQSSEGCPREGRGRGLRCDKGPQLQLFSSPRPNSRTSKQCNNVMSAARQCTRTVVHRHDSPTPLSLHPSSPPTPTPFWQAREKTKGPAVCVCVCVSECWLNNMRPARPAAAAAAAGWPTFQQSSGHIARARYYVRADKTHDHRQPFFGHQTRGNPFRKGIISSRIIARHDSGQSEWSFSAMFQCRKLEQIGL